MHKTKIIILYVILSLFTVNVTASLPENKPVKIGILSRFDDRASLAYDRQMGASHKTSIYYSLTPDFKVNTEISNAMSSLLRKSGKVSITVISSHSEVNTGFYTKDGTIGSKYLNTISKLPELNNLDYLLIVSPSYYAIQGPDFTAPVGSTFLTIPGRSTRVYQFGFISGYRGGLRAFFAADFFLIDLKTNKTIRQGYSVKSKKLDYNRTLTKEEKSELYDFAKNGILDSKKIDTLKQLIFNSILTQDNKKKISKIVESEVDEDSQNVDDVLYDLNFLMTTNNLTPKTFPVEFRKKESELSKYLTELQNIVSLEIFMKSFTPVKKVVTKDVESQE